MRQKTSRWLSIVLTLALAFTIIPISAPVFAAGSIQILNPYGTSMNPVEVNSKKIDIHGMINGVTGLKYELRQQRWVNPSSADKFLQPTGLSTSGEGAQISGNTFVIPAVEIYDGITQITITGKDAITGEAVPPQVTYVELSNLPAILDAYLGNSQLKLDQTPPPKVPKLVDDKITITGSIRNADTIYATVNGSSTEYRGTVTSINTYVIAGIPLQYGSNIIEIVAKNATKTYPKTIRVDYAPNLPYIEGEVVGVNPSNPAHKVALTNPTIYTDNHLLSNNNLRIIGSLNNLGQGNRMTISFNSHTLVINENDISNRPAGYSISNNGIKFTKTSVTNQVYGFELEFDDIAQGGYLKRFDTNRLVLTYTDTSNGRELSKQNFELKHFDESLNKVKFISGVSKNDVVTKKDLSFTVTTEQAVSPFSSLVIHERPDPANPGVWISGNPVTITQVSGLTNTYNVIVTLQEGQNRIIVRPNNNSAGVEHMNQEILEVTYVNSPDVRILNYYDGDLVETNEPAALYFQLFNVTEVSNDGGRSKIAEVLIENSAGRNIVQNNSTNLPLEIASEKIFSIAGFSSYLRSGMNTITIKIREGTTTTSTRITIFYFSTEDIAVRITPKEVNVGSDYTKDLLIPKENNTWETDALYIDLEAWYGDKVRNLNIYHNGVKIVHADLLKPPGNEVEVFLSKDHEYLDFSVDTSQSLLVSNYPITLIPGVNSFRVEGIGAGGSAKSETIYITRSTQSVKIVQPDLSRENVVNSNFIELIIEANADKLTVGKTEATASTDHAIRLVERYEHLRNKYLSSKDYLRDEEIKELIDIGLINKRFTTYVTLKPGKNKVSYQLELNGQKVKGDFEIFYAASPTEGAQYKATLKGGKLDVFDKKLSLSFPKNTWLTRPHEDKELFDQFVEGVDLQFGIVDRESGKLYRQWDPITNSYIFVDFEETYYYFIMPDKFKPPSLTGYAGQIYWIEAPDPEVDADKRGIRWVDSGLVPNKRGQITLAYDSSIRDDSHNILSIYHFDRTNEKWVNLGGVVDTKKKTVTANINEFGYYTVMAKRGTYTDIVEDKNNGKFIQTMFAKGIMVPENTNRFGTELLTNRGEFATMLVKALDIPIDAGPYENGDKRRPVKPTFVDVHPLFDPLNADRDSYYAYEYIETAARAGIVRGKGQNEFMPTELLTREEAAIMIARAANFKLTSDTNKSKTTLSKTFLDVNKMDLTALPFIEATYKEGIMTGVVAQGKMMNFNPKSYLTRAETAAIAYRLMQKIKKLPK